MRIICEKALYPKRDKIRCIVLNTFCPYQRLRICKGEYWHTDGALKCRAKEDGFKPKGEKNG